jgi:hypothetical protein
MNDTLRILAAVALALGLVAVGGCCSMGSGACASGEKSMTCEKKAACSCCAKGEEGGPKQGHQH